MGPPLSTPTYGVTCVLPAPIHQQASSRTPKAGKLGAEDQSSTPPSAAQAATHVLVEEHATSPPSAAPSSATPKLLSESVAVLCSPLSGV